MSEFENVLSRIGENTRELRKLNHLPKWTLQNDPVDLNPVSLVLKLQPTGMQA